MDQSHQSQVVPKISITMDQAIKQAFPEYFNHLGSKPIKRGFPEE
jgi:hypothetical protein